MDLKEIYAPTVSTKESALQILNSQRMTGYAAFPIGNDGLHFSKIRGINGAQINDLVAAEKRYGGNMSLVLK